MKHIKPYSLFERLDNEESKYLYHGSPYAFKQFKNTVTFFSDKRKFAEDYTDTKSMDSGLDANIHIYKVTTTANLFDINNESDYKKLEDKLPDEVKYTYNNFGFDETLPKKEILYLMTGFYDVEPEKGIEDKKIGDKIKHKISMSQHEFYEVYKIDSEYAYAWSKKDYNYFARNSMSDSYSKLGFFNELEKFLRTFVEERTKQKYYSNNVLSAYYDRFLNPDSGRDYFDVGEIDKKTLKEFNKLNDKFEKAIIKHLIDKKYTKKYNLKTQTKKLSDTWRYFENETVLNAIVKMGYDGYIALEKDYNTYAIFEPNNTVKIEEYSFYEGTFKTWNEYLEFNKIIKYIHKNLTSKESLFLDNWKIHKWLEEGHSKEDILKKLKNKK